MELRNTVAIVTGGARGIGRGIAIGEAVVYLARADNVTGIALNVAGGLVMH
jgi:NAD(P)-dependent dehydrogenase (short-subunit alcohol dehydrogenase family)